MTGTILDRIGKALEQPCSGGYNTAMRDLLFDAAAMIIGLQTDLAQTEALEAQHGKVIERLTAERDRFRDALENKP